jgi:hypothetical protein
MAGGQRDYICALAGLCGERRGLSLGPMGGGFLVVIGGDSVERTSVCSMLLLTLSLSGRTPAEQSSKLCLSSTNAEVKA